MKIIHTLAAAAIAVPLLFSPVQAGDAGMPDPICTDSQTAITAMLTQGMQPLLYGFADDGRMTVVFVNPITKSWLMAKTSARDEICVFLGGTQLGSQPPVAGAGA